jgi:hypothetical protein
VTGAGATGVGLVVGAGVVVLGEVLEPLLPEVRAGAGVLLVEAGAVVLGRAARLGTCAVVLAGAAGCCGLP